MNQGTMGVVLRRYGQQVSLDGVLGIRTGRALVQPILECRGKQPQYIPTPLGRRRGDRFLYLGAAELEVRCGDRVECAGERYRVCCAQAIRMGEELSHWWALLRPEDEE